MHECVSSDEIVKKVYDSLSTARVKVCGGTLSFLPPTTVEEVERVVMPNETGRWCYV